MYNKSAYNTEVNIAKLHWNASTADDIVTELYRQQSYGASIAEKRMSEKDIDSGTDSSNQLALGN